MNKFVSIIGVVSLTALVFPAVAQTIDEDFEITASDDARVEFFGTSIANDQGIVVVGATRNNSTGSVSGSAYLFDAKHASPAFGTQLIKLTASDAAIGDQFGISVSIDQGVVAVGAKGADHGSGCVYLFDANPVSPTFGTQLAKFVASDATEGDFFGSSVAIDQGLIVIGAQGDDDGGHSSGSAYIFDANPASPTLGTQLVKLTASDPGRIASFGVSVSIDQGIVAVGADLNSTAGRIHSGSVYLFDANAASPTFGTQLTKLTASDAIEGESFGHSVGIDHGILVIGARFDDDRSGSAYLFDADPTSPTFGRERVKLTASDVETGDLFGHSVAIDHGIVAVGAYFDSNLGMNHFGSAYLFDAHTGDQLAKMGASDATTRDYFGTSISIDQGVVVVGASSGDLTRHNSGSAYIFDISCSADLTGDFILDFFDVADFLTLYLDDDLAVDFNDDGMLDFFDVAEFLEAFSAGCALTS